MIILIVYIRSILYGGPCLLPFAYMKVFASPCVRFLFFQSKFGLASISFQVANVWWIADWRGQSATVIGADQVCTNLWFIGEGNKMMERATKRKCTCTAVYIQWVPIRTSRVESSRIEYNQKYMYVMSSKKDSDLSNSAPFALTILITCHSSQMVPYMAICVPQVRRMQCLCFNYADHKSNQCSLAAFLSRTHWLMLISF